MKFIDSFVIAIRSLAANKMRSSLTMLGIIIGVGAVITLMALGRGVEANITSGIESVGTNLISIMPQSTETEGFAAMSPGYSTPSITLEDSNALERIPHVTAVAPTNENFIRAIAGSESKVAILHGTTPEYLEAYNYELGSGQFITNRHNAVRDMVVVLGYEPAKDLFGDDDPIGQRIKMKGYRFIVIGVMAEKGGSMMGYSLDNIIIVPITTYQARLYPQRTPSGEDAVAGIAVKVDDSEHIDEVKENIEAILTKRHKLDPDEKADFAVVGSEQFLDMFSQITGILTLFLGAIAGISLIVGSIGIMNIMLVSVTERTREIGIRKAVGAKRRDILLQFLIEAATLSLVGGGIGITGGWLVAFIISKIDFGGFIIEASVTAGIVILAVSVSVIIGIFSGMYPAWKASRLNPIDALHYE